MENKNIPLDNKPGTPYEGGQIPDALNFYRDEEIPEFTEAKNAAKNIISDRKDKPNDKVGTVLLLGTGGDPSGLHAARTIFMNDKKDAADYIVAYDPMRNGGFSMTNIVTGMREAFRNMHELGIIIKGPLSFTKIEGPGTGPWKKRVKAKNRYKSQTRKLIENYRQKDFSDYYARATIFPPLDPDQNALPDTINKL